MSPGTAALTPSKIQRFPEVGEDVLFRRSPSHDEEIGFVRARSFGTRRLDVIDTNGMPLSLLPDQYRLQGDGITGSETTGDVTDEG